MMAWSGLKGDGSFCSPAPLPLDWHRLIRLRQRHALCCIIFWDFSGTQTSEESIIPRGSLHNETEIFSR